MGQNYLNGSNSPKINAMLAATGWNLKKLMEKLKKEFFGFIFSGENFSEISIIKQLITKN